MISSETLARLEFDKLLVEISHHAHSPCSAELVLSLKPLKDIHKIQAVSGAIAEIRALDNSGISLALGNFEDIRPSLELLRPAGAVLPPLELLLFIPVLRLYAALTRQLNYREDIPFLKEIKPILHAFTDILEPLVASIDADGSIMDSASTLLKETRRAKRGMAARIRKKIEDIVRDSGIEKFLQDDFITQRSGRWVIPVRMDSKGMVKGVVHDVSSSGETAFMEPLEIIPFVNELENLIAEERAEEIRILKQLSSWLREDAEEISTCFETLLKIDTLNCIARFATEYELSAAVLNENDELKLIDARHPLLLMMQHRGILKNIQPLGLELGGGDPSSYKVMVITGPNAGGKTIALKTAGILALMALTGIPVSAGSQSRFPILDSILVDIGDEQSIEQSHSTFSAHAARVTSIIEKSRQRTLVLLDELGAGTEPLQGAAIACGVLNELQKQGSMVIATTHLSDIIGFVHKTPRMINAGMAFDDVTFNPLYRLIVGEPGESHAVEIAKRFGMPENVITFARQMLGNAGSEFAGLLTELRQKRDDFEKRTFELQKREESLNARSSELDARADEVLQIRKEASEKGWNDAKELISSTRKKMNALLDELRREKRSEIVEKIRDSEIALSRELKPDAAIRESPPLNSVKKGDSVYVSSLSCSGVVLSIDPKNSKIRVRIGRMELDVPLMELSASKEPSKNKQNKQQKTFWKTELTENECSELKLIGMRAEEALLELEPFLNHASAAGLSEVRIIHGIGTGKLRNAIREELGRHPLVEDFRYGEPHEGRDGVTIAKLFHS